MINFINRSLRFTGLTINCQVKKFFQLPDRFSKLEDKDILNKKYIRKLVRINIPKRTQRSQKGLFHGKQPVSGKIKTFSDKKTLIRRHVNVFKKTFYSSILKRSFQINVSSKAYRCMRKYGGFDNYILLTKKSKLDSLYGEYLRELMYRKLNNSEGFDIEHSQIFASGNIKNKRKRYYTNYKMKEAIWHPPEIRHGDLTEFKVKTIDELSKRDLKEYQNIIDKISNNEEIENNTRIEIEEREEILRETKLLEPEIKKAKESFTNRKNKKYKELYMKQVVEAKKEIDNMFK